MTYQVKIDVFEGPLDLLLHLIQKDDLDIYDISISQITAEYISYLDMYKELNLNIAGEFLVMASTLIQIKAKTLLPVDPENAEEGPDPRAELIQRLVEYQKFKAASKVLGAKFERQRNIFYRGTPVFDSADQSLVVEMPLLMEAFRKVLETADTAVRDIIVEEIPVEDRIREILDVLESKPYVTFAELFPAGAPRRVLVVSFLALLELVKLKQVRVTQTENYGDILISRAPQIETEETLLLPQ